jgi:hypothetical protein
MTDSVCFILYIVSYSALLLILVMSEYSHYNISDRGYIYSRYFDPTLNIHIASLH